MEKQYDVDGGCDTVKKFEHLLSNSNSNAAAVNEGIAPTNQVLNWKVTVNTGIMYVKCLA